MPVKITSKLKEKAEEEKAKMRRSAALAMAKQKQAWREAGCGVVALWHDLAALALSHPPSWPV